MEYSLTWNVIAIIFGEIVAKFATGFIAALWRTRGKD